MKVRIHLTIGAIGLLIGSIYFASSRDKQAKNAAPSIPSDGRAFKKLLEKRSPDIDPATTKRQEALVNAAGQDKAFIGLVRDAEGNLNEKILSDLGLSLDQIVKIQSEYLIARRDLQDILKSQIKQDFHRSDATKGIIAYKIPSFPESGDRISSDLKERIGRVVGPDLAGVIYAGLTPPDQFGNFGRQEIHLKMIPSELSEIGYDIEVNFYEPMFMVSVGNRKIQTKTELSLAFGTVFDE